MPLASVTGRVVLQQAEWVLGWFGGCFTALVEESQTARWEDGDLWKSHSGFSFPTNEMGLDLCRSVLNFSQPGWFSWSTKVNRLSLNEQGQMLIISLIR